MSKFTPLVLASLLVVAPALQAATETAAECYEKISKLMAAGKVEESMKLMTQEGRQMYIEDTLTTIAEMKAFNESIDEEYTLSDGTKVKASLADLGMDQLEIPEWFKEAGVGSDAEEKKFFDTLTGLAEKSEDSEKFYRSMALITSGGDGSDFGGKVVKPAIGFEEAANRVWAEFDYEGEKETVPFIFRKADGKWLYEGLDFDAMDKQMYQHIERTNLKISGKTVTGKAIALSDYKGKVVLIDFWGTW